MDIVGVLCSCYFQVSEMMCFASKGLTARLRFRRLHMRCQRYEPRHYFR